MYMIITLIALGLVLGHTTGSATRILVNAIDTKVSLFTIIFEIISLIAVIIIFGSFLIYG